MKNSMAWLALLALPLIAAPALAQQTVIRAAHYLDVERGRLVADAAILVENGKIVSLQTSAPPANAKVIDLGDMTLLPGLMDAHVHLTIDNVGPDFRTSTVTDNAAEAALRAAKNARKTLMAGFTTVRDVGQTTVSLDLINVALAKAIAKGDVEGPDVIAGGHSLSITGGHQDITMALGLAESVTNLTPEHGVADGVDEVLKATRYQIKHGAKVIKIAATAGVLSLSGDAGPQQFTEEEMRTIVQEAERHGVPVAAHAHGTEGIKAAIRAGVSSIEHGSILDKEAIRMMKKRGVFLTATTALIDFTPIDTLPPQVQAKIRVIDPMAKDSVRRAIKAGVPMAVGSDMPVFMEHGDNALEYIALVKRGMNPAGVIKAGTINNAKLFRLDDRGQLKQGLRADIIAVPGNPLDDIKKLQDVRFVMKAGTVYKQP